MLQDKDIFEKQINLRQSTKKASSVPDIDIGDTVTNVAPQDKHKVRDIYLVTGKNNEKVLTQRMLHPISQTPLKFMSRRYEVDPKHLVRINRPPRLEQNPRTISYQDNEKKTTISFINY